MKNARKLFVYFSVAFLSVCSLASCFTITDSQVSDLLSELSSLQEESSSSYESSDSLSETSLNTEITSGTESNNSEDNSSEIESSSEINSSEIETDHIQTETETDTNSQETNTDTQESTNARTEIETETGPIQTETETETGNSNTDTGSGQEGGGETLPTLQERTEAVYRQAVSVGYTGDYETFLANIIYHSVGKICGLTKYEVKNIPVDKYVFDITGDPKHKTRDIFVTHKHFSDFTNEERNTFFYWYADEYGVDDLYNGFDENVTNLCLGIKCTYTITINPNYPNSIIQEYEIEHGNPIQIPEEPIYRRHRFLGWFNRDGRKVNLPFYPYSDCYIEAHWELIINEYTIPDLLSLSEKDSLDFLGYEATMTGLKVVAESQYMIDVIGYDVYGKYKTITLYKSDSYNWPYDALDTGDVIDVRGKGIVMNGHYTLDVYEVSKGILPDPPENAESLDMSNYLDPIAKQELLSVERGLNKIVFAELEVIDTFVQIDHITIKAKFPGDVLKSDNSNLITIRNSSSSKSNFLLVQGAYAKSKAGSLISVPLALSRDYDNSIEGFIVADKTMAESGVYCHYGNARVFKNHQDLIDRGISTRLKNEDIEKYIPNLDLKDANGEFLNASLNSYARMRDRYELRIDFNSYDYAKAANQLRERLVEKGYILDSNNNNIYGKDNNNSIATVEETSSSLRLRFYISVSTYNSTVGSKGISSFEGLKDKYNRVRETLSFNYRLTNFMKHGNLTSLLPSINSTISTCGATGLKGSHFDVSFDEHFDDINPYATYDDLFHIQSLKFYTGWFSKENADSNYLLFEHDIASNLKENGFTYCKFEVGRDFCFINYNTGELISFDYYLGSGNYSNTYLLNISSICLDQASISILIKDAEEWCLLNETNPENILGRMRYLTRHTMNSLLIMPDITRFHIKDVYFNVVMDKYNTYFEGLKAEFRCGDKTIYEHYTNLLIQSGFTYVQNQNGKSYYKSKHGSRIYVEYEKNSLIVHYGSYVYDF